MLWSPISLSPSLAPLIHPPSKPRSEHLLKALFVTVIFFFLLQNLSNGKKKKVDSNETKKNKKATTRW